MIIHMTKILNSLALAIFTIACLTSPAQAEGPTPSRPLGVEDIVALEAFGRGSISPDGRWAIYEKRGRYDAIPQFDFAQRSAWAAMNLWAMDLNKAGSPPELLLPDEGPGLLRVAWSPSGARLLVYRFRAAKFEVGIVALADRSVQWTGLTPEIPVVGASVEWVNDDAVIVMVRPGGSLPQVMRYYSGSQGRLTDAWAKTSRGREPSRTILETQGGIAGADIPEPSQALVMIDLAGGQRRTLAEGGIIDFALSPDSRRLAVVADGEAVPISTGAILQADSGKRHRLSVLDLHGGEVERQMDAYDIAPHLLRWSPDSRSVLVWARRDGMAWDEGGLFQVASDKVLNTDLQGLTPGGPAEILRGVRADWLGQAPVIYARNPDAARFDWHVVASGQKPRAFTHQLSRAPASLAAVTPDTVRFFGDGGLWAADATSVRRVTSADLFLREAVAGDPEEVFRLKFNDAPRQVWATAHGPDGETLVVEESGKVQRLGPGRDLDPRNLALSRNAALVLEREGLVETLRLRTREGDARLDAVNESLSDVEMSEPLPVIHSDVLGRKTTSWLFLPVGRTMESVSGLIVQVYPGSTDTGRWSGPLTLTYGVRAQVLAGAGYAVLSPSIPEDAEAPRTADFRLRSVNLAVDAALEAYPTLPDDRMAVVGHSFGGLTALEIAARSDRYRSYIAMSAPTDAFGFWGEFDAATRIQPEDGLRMSNQQGWAEVGQGKLGVPPWVDPEAYMKFSPYFAAGRITAPVMLINADLDYVPMSQAERVFSVLHRQGRQARLITYWGEHHTLWSPANIRDRYQQIFDWLSITLTDSQGDGTLALDGLPTPAPSPRTPPPP